ncbi:MAG: hypothetical protein ACK4SN_14580, partial [Bellilinea sp.]
REPPSDGVAVSRRAVAERFTSPRAAAGGVAVSRRAVAERFTSPRATVRRRGGLPQRRAGKPLPLVNQSDQAEGKSA